MASSSLEDLAAVPLAAGLVYDPRTVIEPVNRLAEVGKAEALRALRSAADSLAPVEGPLLVARVAFVAAEDAGPAPRLELGKADVDEESATRHFPLFPIALEGDIPFLLVAGYYLGGETDPMAYLAWCEAHGRLRGPLHPAADPLAAADALCRSDAWAAAGLPASHADMVRGQAQRLAEPG
jgi:hypothetical protein